MDMEITLGHAAEPGACPDRCIVCALDAGRCPWCNATGDCEHAVKDGD